MMTMLFGPLKATFQGVCGDRKGAEKTMDEFTKTNPLIFPIRATVDLIADGPEEFKKTCKTFGGAIDSMANSTPVVGHVKGVITAACGDEEKGKEIYLQATRSTAVAATGVGGFILGGPIGAGVLAAEVGTLWDVGRANIDGQCNGVMKIAKSIRDDEYISPGDFFDSFTTPVMDAAAGVAAGKTYDKITKAYNKNQIKIQVEEQNSLKQEQLNKLEKKLSTQGVDNADKVVKKISEKAEDLKNKVSENDVHLRENKPKYIKKQAAVDKNAHANGHTSCTIIDENGNLNTGHSIRLRRAANFKPFTDGISKLQSMYPEIRNVLSRALDACAEHMAFETASGNGWKTFAIKIRDGVVQCVKRCENCAQYPLGMLLLMLFMENGFRLP